MQHFHGRFARPKSHQGRVDGVDEIFKALGRAGSLAGGLVFRPVGGHRLTAHAGIDPGIGHIQALAVADEHVLLAVGKGADHLRDLVARGARRRVRRPQKVDLPPGVHVGGLHPDGMTVDEVPLFQRLRRRAALTLGADGRSRLFGAFQQALPAKIVGVGVYGGRSVVYPHARAVQTARVHPLHAAVLQGHGLIPPVLCKDLRKVAAGG